MKGTWNRDEDTRNSLLTAARIQNFDWMVIQDADEFYRSIMGGIKKLPNFGYTQTKSVINVPLYTFWKTPCFVIEEPHDGIKAGEACFY